MIGALVLAPFMLVWIREKSEFSKNISLIKISIIYASLLFILILTFTFQNHLKYIQFHRLEYLTIPIILWSVFQYGKRGATISIMLTCIIATYFTAKGYGPFIIAPHNDPLLLLQIYLSVIAVTALILTAALEERENIGNKLKLSESRLSDLYENAPDMYVTVDTNTTEIVQCNKTTVDKLGYNKDELIGKSVFYVYPHECIEDAKKIFSTVREKGAVHDAELLLQCKNGMTIDVSLNATSICNEKGTITSSRYVWRDITDHKRAERQIYLAQRMETISRLIGNIAHDFNNILMAIISYSKLTQMKLKDNSLLMEYLDNIVLSAQRASTLIKNLYSLGKNHPLELKPLDLNTVIKNVEILLARAIAEGITLQFEFTNEPCTINANKNQIEQILLHLVINARDAITKEGQITIRTKVVETDHTTFPTQNQGKYAMVSVSDTGHGIDEGIKEKIFEPFFTTKGKEKGTGLGLSIVYGIVKQHNAYINVFSETGKGSRFEIYFPFTDIPKEEEENITTQQSLVSLEGTETLLIAEDQDVVRDVLQKILEEKGYKIITAKDGEDAVAKFEKHKDTIKMLLFDVMMPNKNGKEAYDTIKTMRSDIKALFLSGYSSDIITNKTLQEEGLSFIHKPVTPNVLLAKIRNILDT
ncbi:MAG: response regulator [Candidatus Kuenenia sp.]|nr:response regulator [Candidatus Kuenenia hertensis]